MPSIILEASIIRTGDPFERAMEKMNKWINTTVRYAYSLPEERLLLYFVVIILLWIVLLKLAKGRSIISAIGVVGILLSVIAIVIFTLVGRTKGVREIILLPGFTLFRAIKFRDLYRQFVLNVVLFIPLGMSSVLIMKTFTKERLRKIVFFAFVLSVTIELLQFVFMRGCAEIDDVIANTVGALIGALVTGFFIN